MLEQAKVYIRGGDFRLNNLPITQLDNDLEEGDFLTGIMSDGTPFLFAPDQDDVIPASGLVLTQTVFPAADTTPIVLEDQIGPRGYRGVERVDVLNGGVVPSNATAFDTHFVVDGGEIEHGFAGVRSKIELRSGELGWSCALFDHSELIMHDGFISSNLTIGKDSRFTMYGGRILWETKVASGAVFDQYDGETESGILVYSGGTYNVRGGSRSAFRLIALDGGEVNFFVRSATINGVPMQLTNGVRTVVTERGGAIFEGVLENGDPFRRELHDDISISDIYMPGSVLTVTQVVGCTADLSGDGVINFFDVSAFLVAYQAQDLVADFNRDGLFSFFDVSAFLVAFSAGCP